MIDVRSVIQLGVVFEAFVYTIPNTEIKIFIRSFGHTYPDYNGIYYINTDEIKGFAFEYNDLYSSRILFVIPFITLNNTWISVEDIKYKLSDSIYKEEKTYNIQINQDISHADIVENILPDVSNFIKKHLDLISDK